MNAQTVVQIIATVIFVAMFVLIVLDKIERQYVTLGCGLLTLIFVLGIGIATTQGIGKSLEAIRETIGVHTIFTPRFWYQAGEGGESSSGINWATIFFIAGMMVMVEGMARVGFFRWLCMTIAKWVNYKPIPIFVTFMFLSAFLAMFIDSITVILFLARVTIELANMLKFNPVPVILTEIFCANLGGSATMCGDPPNIIVGTSLHKSFFDFLTNTGAIAGISLVVVVIYFFIMLKNQIQPDGPVAIDESAKISPKSAIVDKNGFIASTVIFLLAVVLLVTHSITGLTVATIGIFIALLTILTSIKYLKEIFKGVDYKTLLFFVGLFVVVGGLEQTRVLNLIADFIERISGGKAMVMVAIILWVSAVASAFVDNIPFAATMIPVIKRLSSVSGVDLSTLAWTLSLGTDIGGSATPIGASANVVGISVATEKGHPIGWGKYCKALAPATIIVLFICMVCIFVRYL